MPNETQGGFFFKVGDGESPEAFTQLEGMEDVPEIPDTNKTTRPARTVGDSGNTVKHKFNRLQEGAEFDVQCKYLPNDSTQEELLGAIGNDAGVNIETGIVGDTHTHTRSFNVMVVQAPIQPAAPNDTTATDKITFKLRINSDITKATAANA